MTFTLTLRFSSGIFKRLYFYFPDDIVTKADL